MKTTATVVLALALLLPACSSVTPVAIRAGDLCNNCGRTITDVKLAAEAISASGQALKFRTVGCMARYLAKHPGPVQAAFVTDYPSGRMVRAQNATFVRADIDPATGERDYYAFAEWTRASEFGKANEATGVDWFSIMQQTAASKSD